ncbi:sulfatase family protein [Rubinisphaera italica]|uniref:Arylsulfatase n=1 Tax=Rubinisphaera italica TaxID=2527969 RepID=A0A5C5XQH8_9PLAN|nr:arylsulfatase [Rubinisphaera italica]TWT64325.1 Arylsulfatase [Rubinisphaera italica]
MISSFIVRLNFVVIIVLLNLWNSSADAGSIDKPNIILIYTDDQGYGDVSCLNPESKFQTPNMDRIAQEGLTFTNAHCSDTVCTPSRYGLLTGRYCWRTTMKTGVLGAEHECLIDDDRMTLATLLRGQGYETAMVGKWHLGMDFPGTPQNRDWTQPVQDMPLDKGFNYFYGIPASLNYGILAWFEGRYAKVPPTQFTRKKPNDLAISDYRIQPPYQKELSKGLFEIAPDFVDSECLTRFTEKSIEYIENHTKSPNSEKPFFLYLPYTSPHKPVIPLPKFRGQGAAGAYGEFLIETDYHIGQILKCLDEHKLTKNTLVILTSDNGPENTYSKRYELYDHKSAGPYRGGKRDAYEGGHRVPFLIRWPNRIEAGRVWDGAICQTDLLATFAQLLDVTLAANAGEDSFSFLDVIVGKSNVKPRPAMIHHEMQGRFAIRNTIEGVEWKLILSHGKQERELYNLTVDRSETRNVYGENPEISRVLESEITAIIKDGRTNPGPQVPNDTGWWNDLMWMEENSLDTPDKKR